MNAPEYAEPTPVEILIAEDSRTQAQRLERILTQHGYRVTVAVNGRLALEAAKERPPGVIISDVIMPEMDGYELCRAIKSDPQLADVPVILVTTMSDPEDVIRGLECRADNFILKPYDERYLLSRLQFVLVNREMRQADHLGLGLEVIFNGQRHYITADRLQILNLLLSTYDAAIQRNRELSTTQEKLREANSGLQALTAELEARVTQRTEDLARSNRALQDEISVRRQAEQRLQSKMARLDLLSRTTRAIGDRQDLASIFQVVLRSLEDHLPTDFGCVFLTGDEDSNLRIAAWSVRNSANASGPQIQGDSVPRDCPDFTRALAGQLVYEADVSRLDAPFARALAQGGLRSAVFAPLLADMHVFGVVIVARAAAESFSSGDCEFLRQLSEHVALASNQARLHTELRQAYDDLRRTQQAIMQQERLRALGQMASGIAHDINNAISPVALYTESLLEKETGLSARGRQYLTTIQSAIDDVTATVARMREFYRQREQEAATTSVSLNRLVEQVLELTRVRWNDMPQQRGIMIRLVKELAPELPIFQGVENEIRDALTNLILNAVDAMTSDGTLTIRTRTSERAADQKQLVVVEVADTGAGMDDETRRRCLEPFFTTKGERGTGLGLAMVYGMAQRHKGDVEIESQLGAGTTMRVCFPAADGVASAQTPILDPEEPLRPLRVLLVDDDPLLIRSVSDVLGGEGHLITAADGGQQGIDAFTAAIQGGQPFDAVITDLGMPYVDGRKVAASIKEQSPSTPVILLTGWGQRMVAEGEIPEHIDHVLSKPPKLRELVHALRLVTTKSGGA